MDSCQKLSTNLLGGLEFSTSSFFKNLSNSRVQITNKFLYSNFSAQTCQGGLLDPKMGASKNNICKSCKKDQSYCSGHFGYIKLFLPVLNIGYLKAIHLILSMICKVCSRVLVLPGKRREYFLKFIRKIKKKGEGQKIDYLSQISQECRKFDYCPYCWSKNGSIRKFGTLGFVHDFKFQKNKKIFQNINYDPSLMYTEKILDPLSIFRIFQKISREDWELLDFDFIESHPTHLILYYLPIPPLGIRPTVFIGETITNEDDLTIKLTEIQFLNTQLKINFQAGISFSVLKDTWSILQIECGKYLNSEAFNLDSGKQKFKSLFNRLKGKNGRFRGNLSGKRVNFSGRTVISPDPILPLNFLGLPIVLATKLTFPERVNKFNIDRLQRTVLRGTSRFPGANFLIDLKNNKKKIENSTEEKKYFEIKKGFKIERHLKNNDVILFNRQPSLHRISIMAHRTKIISGKTLKINECICKPYNADFDGDEMNIHIPQTQKARAECISLLNLVFNINSPGTGESMIAATQDFLSASFILTSKNQFFSHDQIGKILHQLELDEIEKSIFIPSVLKPFQLWTGKQVFSVIVFSKKKDNPKKRKNFQESIFHLMEKNYSLGKKQCSPFLCPFDGWILFKNRDLLAGQLGKSSLGSENKFSIFSSLSIFNSNNFILKCLLKISKMTSSWFSNFGFSFGIRTITPHKNQLKKKNLLVKKCYNLCNSYKKQSFEQSYKKGRKEKHSESSIQKIFSILREELGNSLLIFDKFSENSGKIMTSSGSKGSKNNLSQMTLCLGQQFIGGERIKKGFLKRVLPHFYYSKLICNPSQNGFIQKSFLHGLNSVDFFFHSIAGREGLIDTAIKTSETGYLQRRLMKTLEDIVIYYDYSARTSDGRLIQPKFGLDCINPGKISSLFGLNNSYQEIKKFYAWKENNLNFSERETFLRSFSFVDMDSIPFFLKIRDFAYGFFNMKNLKKKINFLDIEKNMKKILENCSKFKIEPGSSVGALAAQSIGEPGTQMTLQTFHHAGISDLNITQGVPRINEIMNASRKILSPIVSFDFFNYGKKNFFQCKLQIEKIYFGEICDRFDIIIDSGLIFIDIFFKKIFLNKLGLNLNFKRIIQKIGQINSFWNKSRFFYQKSNYFIRIFPSKPTEKKIFSYIEFLKIINSCKKDFSQLEVCGFSDPKNISFFQKPKFSSVFCLNSKLLDVFDLLFVNLQSIYCNHILMILETFGIEASRKVIIIEIQKIFRLQNISINQKHFFLLAEIMTFQGKILGITRYGISKMKENKLVLASFEKTMETLFSAAFKNSKDKILGVSESIILGRKPPNGTGLVTLISQK
uniref:DNA-directed RNA polymerase subunit n=1 Tax=Hemiselmis tepida TaxID=464990 RepID=A0A7S0W1B3_9CRYP|mmetsp:Transcript_3526/g.9120  ORF Transcript_3526/g.9120 Transcript_3526/m.9120 type:complete len:1327 (+) Transcript_3526:125-4105(+)